MRKFEDMLHAFLDGEITESQEISLIHSILSSPERRQQFVKACRVHYATLSAFSGESAAQFKGRLDSFCARWEEVGDTQCAAFSSRPQLGFLHVGAAAILTATLSLSAFNFWSHKQTASQERSDKRAVYVELVNPTNSLEGEPLYLAFGVAEITSDDVQPTNSDDVFELSDSFSKAYIKLLRDERVFALGEGSVAYEEPQTIEPRELPAEVIFSSDFLETNRPEPISGFSFQLTSE